MTITRSSARRRAVELGCPDVYRVHADRTLLEQAVGESSRGSSHVETHLPLHVDREVLQGVGQLVASSAHEALTADQLDEGGRRHQRTHLVNTLPVDKHLAGHDPAGGPLAASDQPRSTSRRSMRTRCGMLEL